MKRVLILFDQLSIETGKAHPRRLLDQLDEFSKNVEYTSATYDDLVFSINNDRIEVTLGLRGRDVSDFAAIYFRRFHNDQARATAVALYAQFRGVRVIDSEIISRKGSISKLTQYMKMAIGGIQIPATYCTSGRIFNEVITQYGLPFEFPCIMKIADATRGADNELIASTKQALQFVANNPDAEILAQEYIDNDGDYRVWTLGNALGPVFYRQRDLTGDTHKNNTSQGAHMSLVNDASLIDVIGNIALDATRLFNREVSGVDVVLKKGSKADYRVFEVNRAPQLEFTDYEKNKAQALAMFIENVVDRKAKLFADVPATIGVSSTVDFSGYKNLKQIPARIDTGARTSAVWASNIKVRNGVATFKLFGPRSQWYTGKVIRRKVLEMREVTSSTGHTQIRHLVTMPIHIHGKKLNAKFTLSDRSTQMYPILIGRNTLRGNFIVDSSDPGEAHLYRDPFETDEFNESEAL